MTSDVSCCQRSLTARLTNRLNTGMRTLARCTINARVASREARNVKRSIWTNTPQRDVYVPSSGAATSLSHWHNVDNLPAFCIGNEYHSSFRRKRIERVSISARNALGCTVQSSRRIAIRNTCEPQHCERRAICAVSMERDLCANK